MNYEENDMEHDFEQYAKLVKLSEEIQSMVTPVDIQSGLEIIKLIFAGFSQALDIAETNKDYTTKKIIVGLESKTVDLESLLLKAKREINILVEENEALKQELQSLKSDQQELIYDLDKNVYYRKDDTEKKNAYCSSCWENKKEKHTFMKINRIGGFNMGYICPKCKMNNDKID